MRKTATGSQADAVLRERVEPLASATVSTTVRLPVELTDYVAELVATGQAKDKTDAVIRCIRRHQETQAGMSDLGRLEAGQADLAEQLEGLVGQLQGLRDDLVLVGSQTSGGLEGMQQTLAGLLTARLYGGDDEALEEGGGSMSPDLPVTLMAAKAPSPAPAPRRPRPELQNTKRGNHG